MKRLVILLSIILSVGTASAQQNINDSLKKRPLFRMLVQVKGTLLKEIDAISKINHEDSLARHFEYMDCLCYIAIRTIENPEGYEDQLNYILRTGEPNCEGTWYIATGEKGGSREIKRVLQQLGEVVKYPVDMPARRKALLILEPDLRTAIITY